MQRFEHGRITRAAAGGDDRVATTHIRALAVAVFDHHAIDRAFRVLNEIDSAGVGHHGDASRLHALVELRSNHREDRAAVLCTPVIARHRVIVVQRADRRLFVRDLQADLRKPVDHATCMVGPQSCHLRNGRAGADLHDVVVVLLRRVLNAFRLLEDGTRSAHHAAGNHQRAAEAGGLFDDDDVRATIRREYCGDHACRSAANDDERAVLLRVSTAYRPGKAGQRRGGRRALEQRAPGNGCGNRGVQLIVLRHRDRPRDLAVL